MKKRQPFRILQLTVILMFAGRVWQHWFLSTPYREFFWNRRLFGWFSDRFLGITWNEYLLSETVEQYTNGVIIGVGCVFALGIAGTIWVNRLAGRIGVCTAWAFLWPFAWFHFMGNIYNWALLFEFSAQFFTPLLLLYFRKDNARPEAFITLVKVVLAVTFISHGLYASGIYPVPQKFLTMTMNILPVNKAAAIGILRLAGIADFLVAVGLFYPALYRICLWYMMVWGFLTAFARIYANLYIFDIWRSLFQWTYDFLIRSPHYLLPLLLLMLQSKRQIRR